MSLGSESIAKNLGLYIYNFEKPVLVGFGPGASAVKIVHPLTQERLRILSCVGELSEAGPPTPLSRRENALENLVYEEEGRQFLVGEAAKAFSPWGQMGHVQGLRLRGGCHKSLFGCA